MRRKIHGFEFERVSEKWPTSTKSGTRPCQAPLRVFIADTYEILRVGARALLEEVSGFAVVGESDNLDDMHIACERTKPDVVLLGARLSGGEEGKICRKLSDVAPSAHVLSLLWDKNEAVFHAVDEPGPDGYLLMKADRTELVRAIHVVVQGGMYLSPEIASEALHLLRQRRHVRYPRSGLELLSPQEFRVLSLIAEGNTNKEIATALVLSDKTVKNYVGNMFAKLEIERRTQAVALYLKGGQYQNPV